MAAADALIAAGRRADAKPFVGRALAEARSVDYPAFFWPVPDVAARVCALALETRHRDRLRAQPHPRTGPAATGERARQLAVEVPHPRPRRFPRRAGRRRLTTDSARASAKPMELLRAVVALGGQRVGVDRLVSLLWPGEGRVGAGRRSTSRCCGCAGCCGADNLVVLSEGEVSLDHAARGGGPLEAGGRAGRGRGGGDDAVAAALAGVVDSYAGPLLPDESAAVDRGRAAQAAAARRRGAGEGDFPHCPASTPRRCCRARWRPTTSCRSLAAALQTIVSSTDHREAAPGTAVRSPGALPRRFRRRARRPRHRRPPPLTDRLQVRRRPSGPLRARRRPT